uniref:Alpha-casein n=1 Tax=Ascaris lumbricoides TaxID=6252 RepID=A0A0M3I0G4_ASCLU
MIRYTTAMCLVTMIGVSGSQEITSLKESSDNPQQHPNPNPSPVPATVSVTENQTLSSKQPLESLEAVKTVMELQQTKEREFQRLMNASLLSTSHSPLQYRPHSTEAPQRSADDSFSASDWDFLSNKWTLPQFEPHSAIHPPLFPSPSCDFRSYLDAHAKQLDDHLEC